MRGTSSCAKCGAPAPEVIGLLAGRCVCL